MGKMTIRWTLIQLAGGMGTSIQILLVTLTFSLLPGLLVAFGHASKNQLLQVVVEVYTSIMRGAPLILQLVVVYFGLYYLFRIRAGSDYRLWAVFIGFVISYVIYFTEIYRSGIQSTPVGQYGAAQILGCSWLQTLSEIVLPQIIKRILPSVINEVTTLAKDISLAFTLSAAEIFSTARILATSQTDMIPSVAAGLFYYIFNLVVAAGMKWVEKKVDYYRQEQEDCGL